MSNTMLDSVLINRHKFNFESCETLNKLQVHKREMKSYMTNYKNIL
jgi:hypothetical protein